MPSNQAFSLISELHGLGRRLSALSCPGCGRRDPHPIWLRDRYFLRVELSACRGCSLVYLARGLHGEVQDTFYTEIYPRLMRQPPSPHMLWNYRLLAGYRYSEISRVIGAFDSVLDVGAGLGFFLDACRAHGCAQYRGLEPGRPQREHAIRDLGLDGHIDSDGLGDATRLSFAPRLVTLFHVLEHLEHPGTALRQIAGLMDPQGWLVVEVPDIRADWRVLGLQQIHISHRSYFCEQTLVALLRKHGFTVHHTFHEPHGIYNGNLRVFAKLGGDAVDQAAPSQEALRELAAHIVGQIKPLSLRNGFPRAAVRLCRLTLNL